MRFGSGLLRAMAAGALIAAAPAFAWSNQGHMATGGIAYDALAASDPAIVAKMVAIMADHPDHARFDAALNGLDGAARARRLFELMARWPDDIRGGPYDHPGWHYWLRIVPSTADPIALPPAMLAVATGEAVDAYALNLATVRDAYAPAADRAIALCWILHLVGDIQQPLHAGHLVSKRFPLTDRAGESAFVKPDANAAATSLHQYWDHAVDARGPDADNEGAELARERIERAWPRAALTELDGRTDAAAFRGWADESFALARTTAYAGAAFQGALTAAAAEPVPPAYRDARDRLAPRRIALGGQRIADALRTALGQ